MIGTLLRLFSNDLAIDLGTANTLVYARKKGIDVMNTPGANANAVAEEVVALILADREGRIVSANPALEAITDRLMHRLQIRDFGAYKTMVTAHTVGRHGH